MEKIKKKIGIDVSEQVSENQLQKQEETKVATVGEKETKKVNLAENKDVLKSELKKAKLKEEKK